MAVRRRTAWVAALATSAVVAGGIVAVGDRGTEDGARAVASRADRPAENPAAPDEWLYAQRANADGTIPATAYREAVAASARIAAETESLDAQTARTSWQLLGPSNIGGRIVDLVADPSTPDRVYVAAGTGGMWRSDDGGRTFVEAWDENLPQSMGAVAVTPDGTVFAGTGEPDHGGGGSYYGTGVYRSTDAGRTWENVGFADSGAIGRIQVDPADPSRIFVGAQGRLFDTEGTRGLFLSEDGGDTWRKVLEGANSSTGTIDISINPADPDVILTAMWDKLRFPDHRDYGGPGSGVFRSTDGGQTWTRVGDPLPASSTEPGRIGVAFAGSDPNRAYAITNTGPGAHTGFFRSDDMGATWTRIPTGDADLARESGGFAWWFGRLWVDPDDENHVFSAGVRMLESTNGGATWTRSLTIHVDQHAVDWDPFTEDRVYVGNDGGFYRSDSNGSVLGAFSRPEAQPWMQFYALDVSRQDVSRVNGGTQDNNSLRSWGVGETDWNPYVGGDGMFNRIAPDDQNVVFGCSQNGGCRRSDDGGETTQSMRSQFAGTRFNWASPLEIAQGSPQTMYFGSNVLNRSDDRGRTWRQVSPDLSDGPTPANASSY
ncbi:MAG: exo-alpha-sialidase, partial [Actinomycetes bacterium]